MVFMMNIYEHKIKITQLNSMILISLSFAEDALYNEVDKYETF